MQPLIVPVHTPSGCAVMAELLFFGLPDGKHGPPEQPEVSMQQQLAQLCLQQQQPEQPGNDGPAAAFDSSRDYLYQDFLYGLEGRPAASGVPAAGQHPADHQQQRQQQDDGQEGQLQAVHHGVQWAYLRFSQPVTAAADSLIIGSKLDADLHTSTCRLAFYGRICCLVDPSGVACCSGQAGRLRGRKSCVPATT